MGYCLLIPGVMDTLSICKRFLEIPAEAGYPQVYKMKRQDLLFFL